MLDPFTTLFTTALTTVTCGMLLLICCGRDGNTPLLTWAVAMIFAAAGFVMTAIANGRGGWLESVAVAILIQASALFWTATRRFRGAGPRWVLAVAGPIVWLGTAPLQTQSPLWTAVSCAVGTAYTVASTRELLWMRGERLPSWLPLVALITGHAGLYACRAAVAVGQAVAPDWITAPTWISVALLMEAMIHINASTVLLAALSREQQESEASCGLRAAAYQDCLTGIANRRRFDERLDELANDPRQQTARLGLILLDLDRFKSVNDTVGHGEGDRILRLVADIISSSIRPDADLAVRHGGEEFAVVITNCNSKDLSSTAERIRMAVEAAAIPHAGTGGVVTISLGVGMIDMAELRQGRHEFIAATDRALYEAKQRGRNRVCAAEPLSIRRAASLPQPQPAACSVRPPAPAPA